MSRRFYAVLANSLTASVANTFIWFAVTFWVYLETQSVIVTSWMAGIYLVCVAISGFLLGSIVDKRSRKSAMLLSSGASLLLYVAAFAVYLIAPEGAFSQVSSVYLWLVILLSLMGALAGNLRGIALSTLVTLLVDEGERDRANGLVGSTTGFAFLGASILSGLVVGYGGVTAVFVITIALTCAALAHLVLLDLPEKAGEAAVEASPEPPAKAGEAAGAGAVDLRGTVAVILAVPGLLGLIFFNTINNFLGGVFMSLMDPYGLQLVSVQVWGTLWGLLSLGFIIGGLVVARRGLGRNPLRSLFLTNIVLWTITIFFPMQPSIVLLSLGMLIYLCLIPVIEAAEQTILQKVIPLERQGRVFGFAQSVEMSASPLTAFIIGPIAQLFFIPYMTTGAGVQMIGDWFGVGPGRGIALLFVLTGVVGLAITLIAMRTPAYRALSRYYLNQPAEVEAEPVDGFAPAGALPVPVPVRIDD